MYFIVMDSASELMNKNIILLQESVLYYNDSSLFNFNGFLI